jgi:hypothetical protein
VLAAVRSVVVHLLEGVKANSKAAATRRFAVPSERLFLSSLLEPYKETALFGLDNAVHFTYQSGYKRQITYFDMAIWQLPSDKLNYSPRA